MRKRQEISKEARKRVNELYDAIGQVIHDHIEKYESEIDDWGLDILSALALTAATTTTFLEKERGEELPVLMDDFQYNYRSLVNQAKKRGPEAWEWMQ